MESSRLYELILSHKTDIEKSRDEINKYYTSLFAAILSFIPFLDKIHGSIEPLNSQGNRPYVPILLSLLGVMLAVSWKLTLQRIHSYLKGTEELLFKMEKGFEVAFITHMFNYLSKTHAPGRVTKQQLLVPYAFIIIFAFILAYSLASILF